MSERTVQAAPTSESKPRIVAASPIARRSLVARQCACGGTPGPSGECAECRRKRLELRRSPRTPEAPAPSLDVAPEIVGRVLQSPGSPLDGAVRSFLEPRLGHDLGRVRVHTDGRAASSARAVGAKAYAVGRDVVFGGGQYAPQTAAGLELLAHELTHTLQQAASAGQPGGALQRRLEIGAVDDPAERQADRVARQVMAGGTPALTAMARGAGAPVLRRVPTTPQLRGGEVRKATLEQPPQGADQVRLHILRYLCQCRGFDVTRTSLQTRSRPSPGVTLGFCRGRTTLEITGDVIPSGFLTGTARAGVGFNVAPVPGSPGFRGQVQGVARNTGAEPQLGGRATASTELFGRPVTVSGQVLRGTQTGRIEPELSLDFEAAPGTSVGVTATGPLSGGGQVLVGATTDFGGERVERDICRECRCPVVYNCIEDILPRSFPEEVELEVEDKTSLRYYFSLNSTRDARDPGLRAESKRSLDRLAQLVAAGASVVSITGHASPEGDQERRVEGVPALNEALSNDRGKRLHELVAARLGPGVSLPEPTGGGELLGSRPTILPGSGLGTAIISAGFSGPEEVASFLYGEEIANEELATEFLALLNRVTEREDRLRLFGVDASSPIADQLIGAIESFIAAGGRGRRPWDRVFEFLRVATVKVSQTRTETRTETRTTSGSVRRVEEALCNRHAREAEQAGLFGPAEAPPTESTCPTGPVQNPGDLGARCEYTK